MTKKTFLALVVAIVVCSLTACKNKGPEHENHISINGGTHISIDAVQYDKDGWLNHQLLALQICCQNSDTIWVIVGKNLLGQALDLYALPPIEVTDPQTGDLNFTKLLDAWTVIALTGPNEEDCYFASNVVDEDEEGDSKPLPGSTMTVNLINQSTGEVEIKFHWGLKNLPEEATCTFDGYYHGTCTPTNFEDIL